MSDMDPRDERIATLERERDAAREEVGKFKNLWNSAEQAVRDCYAGRQKLVAEREEARKWANLLHGQCRDGSAAYFWLNQQETPLPSWLHGDEAYYEDEPEGRSA